MRFVTFSILAVYVVMVPPVQTQDCRVGGKRCMDHEQCCGGCCIEGECIDTYRSCYLPFELCRDHVCVGDETCIVFVPPQCPGCEPQALCK